MPSSVVSDASKRTPNLWKEAYNALRHDEKGKERLDKLNDILREQLGKPQLKLRSESGFKELQAMISKKSQELAAKPSSEKVGIICNNMLKVEELVSTAANVGGPYVAIPAAALFLAFSVTQIYRAEKQLMFELAAKVSHYTVLHATGADRVKILQNDKSHIQDLKKNLHMVYVGMYKSLLLAIAQITISLYGDWQFIKNLFKHYDWEGQIKELDNNHQWCKDYREELKARMSEPDVGQIDQKKAMGPGPRNQLHWAVAFSVPEQVTYLVQKGEYPINALTKQRWTAAHLAARQGNTGILKTLLTAGGIDLKIRNQDGSTPLHISALHGKVGATKLLLQRDCGLLNIRDNRGHTAFLLAAFGGHPKVINVLKENGQNLNEATTKEGWTGLHLAADAGHLKVVQYLVENGAKKSIKVRDGNRKGMNAKQLAELKSKSDIAAIL